MLPLIGIVPKDLDSTNPPLSIFLEFLTPKIGGLFKSNPIFSTELFCFSYKSSISLGDLGDFYGDLIIRSPTLITFPASLADSRIPG